MAQGNTNNQHILHGNKLFKCALNIVKHWNHFVLLSVCDFLSVVPAGLRVCKPYCISGVSESFSSNWRDVERNSSYQLMSLLKQEHLQISRQLETEFWATIPDTITSSSEPAFKSWIDKLCVKLTSINKQWMKTQHKKVSRWSPGYIQNCKDLTIMERYSFKLDLHSVRDELRPNFSNVTDNRKERRKKRIVSADTSKNTISDVDLVNYLHSPPSPLHNHEIVLDANSQTGMSLGARFA